MGMGKPSPKVSLSVYQASTSSSFKAFANSSLSPRKRVERVTRGLFLSSKNMVPCLDKVNCGLIITTESYKYIMLFRIVLRKSAVFPLQAADPAEVVPQDGLGLFPGEVETVNLLQFAARITEGMVTAVQEPGVAVAA